MEALIQKISEEAIVKSESILGVSGFLNMQVDAQLMSDIGRHFSDCFREDDFDIYLTVETSGIAPSVFASLYSDKPLVIIKKQHHKVEGMAQQKCYSYTKKENYYLTVDPKFIKGKRCILIDDFLASGSVVRNVESLLKEQDATLVKTGIVISKDFQEGMQYLEKEGYDVVSLARIKKMDPVTGSVEFIE